jgi:RAB protein geranylgeranyltransferase component A
VAAAVNPTLTMLQTILAATPDETGQPVRLPREVETFDRRFNIDLLGQPVYAASAFVDVLIQSNVNVYVEFKAIDQVLLYDSATRQLLPVPSSKSDVFTSKSLSLIEKRKLMKFLQQCNQDPCPFAEQADTPFLEFITTHQPLTPVLRTFLLHAIVRSPSPATVTTREALASIAQHLRSLNKFPNMKTSFIFPDYGVSEFPQAFCRLAAVCGGVYVLHRAPASLMFDPATQRVASIFADDGTHLRASHYFFSAAYLSPPPAAASPAPATPTYRCVCLTNRSLVPDTDHLLITIPPASPELSAVTVLQLSSTLAVCPARHWLVSFSSHSPGLAGAVRDLLSTDPYDQSKPFLFLAIYFTVTPPNPAAFPAPQLPLNLTISPDFALAHHPSFYDQATEFARTAFQTTIEGPASFLTRPEAVDSHDEATPENPPPSASDATAGSDLPDLGDAA